jgi:hypothetical protein
MPYGRVLTISRLISFFLTSARYLDRLNKLSLANRPNGKVLAAL